MAEIWSYRASVTTSPAIDGYEVEATDGSIGRVDRATYESGSSYIVVDTGTWIPGTRVLLPAGVISSIDHENTCVHVGRTRGEIEAAPEFGGQEGHGEAFLEPFGDYYWGSYGNTAE